MANLNVEVCEMLDRAKLAPAARLEFKRAVREKVEWIASKCWESNLKNSVAELGNIVIAGVELDVTETRVFSDEELAELVSELRPLKTLCMAAEIKDALIAVLAEHDMDTKAIFGA